MARNKSATDTKIARVKAMNLQVLSEMSRAQAVLEEENARLRAALAIFLAPSKAR